FFFQAEDGIRDFHVTGVQTCALPISCGSKTAAKPEMPPPVVLVADVKQEDVPLTNEFVGSLEGLVNAAIQARVSGYLIEQHYKEGRLVKKGDLLFTIDSRPFEAALAQAKAALAQAEAAEKQAELLADRNVDLFKRNAVSAQERDNSVQFHLAAQAQVRAQRAAVEQAVLDVEFT